MAMVTGIEKVAVQDYAPQVAPQARSEGSAAGSTVRADDAGSSVVVSKDFILNLLSLAVGSSVLDGNLGRTVDVKV